MSEELQEEDKCALFSPQSCLFDTVIMDILWTHCDDPFKRHTSPPSLSSFSPQRFHLRTPARRKQRLEPRMAESGGEVMGHSKMRWAGTCAAAFPSNNIRHHFSHLFMFLFFRFWVTQFYPLFFLASLKLSILGMLWNDRTSSHTYTHHQAAVNYNSIQCWDFLKNKGNIWNEIGNIEIFKV